MAKKFTLNGLMNDHSKKESEGFAFKIEMLDTGCIFPSAVNVYNVDDVKELKGEMKELRGDIKELHSDVKALEIKVESDIANVKADIKVLDAKIETGFKALEVSNKQGKTFNKWIFGMLVTLLLGLGGLAAAVLL